MKNKYIKILFQISIAFLLHFCFSCATLFNKKTEKISLLVKKPTQISVDQIGVLYVEDKIDLDINRSKQPLKIGINEGDFIENISINSKNSIAYYLNFSPFYGTYFLGEFIDHKSPKRYSYPRYITINNEDPTQIKYQTNNYKHLALKNNIKLTFLRLYDPAAPTLELNYERKLSEKFTGQFMYGTIFSYLKHENDILNGHRKGIELKYFFKKTAPIGPYLSLGFQNLSSKLNTQMRFFDAKPDSLNYYQSFYLDSIKVARKINALNVKIGYQLIRNKFITDFFVGVGIRHRNVRHFDRQFQNDKLAYSRHGSVFEYVNEEGKWFTPSISLNLKLGYAFK